MIKVKFVAKASQWCLTHITLDGKDKLQKQYWFSTEQEANEKAEQLNEWSGKDIIKTYYEGWWL